MSKPRNLDDGDLKKVSGGADIFSPQPGAGSKRDDTDPPPPPPSKPISGGAGNTDSDEGGNTGGENEFYQG